MTGGGVVVLAVPDGAAETPARGPTSLQRAATPALDALAARGRLRRVTTVPAGLPPGTEVGLPALLGVLLTAPPARGRLEAAAVGERLAAGEAAWRLDAHPPLPLDGAQVAAVHTAAAAHGGRVRHLGGHRMLLAGPAAWGDAPAGRHQTTRGAQAAGPLARVVAATTAALRDRGVRATTSVWGRAGEPGELGDVPSLLGRPVTVMPGSGAARGVAVLTGCAVATGDPADVVAAAPDGAAVVVHDGRPDDAGHARDPAGKVAALETFDAETVAPVAAVLRRRAGGRLVVCSDHGCDPATGGHTGAPVPAVAWPHPGTRGTPPRRMTERAVARLTPVAAATLLSGEPAAGERIA